MSCRTVLHSQLVLGLPVARSPADEVDAVGATASTQAGGKLSSHQTLVVAHAVTVQLPGSKTGLLE